MSTPSDACIAAFERQYDTTWADPALRNERLSWIACWKAASACQGCAVQQGYVPVETLSAEIKEPQASLLPCPFCGGKAVLDMDTGWKAVECENHCCGMHGEVVLDEADAISRWNKRTASPQLAAVQQPVVVPSTTNADEANEKYGEAYSVDWVYAAVEQGVLQIKANCYSNDDGDYWRDCPDDGDFVEGLKVGDTFELQASIRSWSETFRVTKAPDDKSDDYEIELVSSNAPLATHPTQQGLDAAQKTEAFEHGDHMRVCVIENDGTSLIVPAGDLQNHIAEIADIEDAELDDEVSYTLTFKSMPRADLDALPEFNGF